MDIDAINRTFAIEVSAGRLAMTDGSWDTINPTVAPWINNRGNNASHIHHINARDSQGKTQIELESSKSLLRLYRFLKRQPGLKNLTIKQAFSRMRRSRNDCHQGKTHRNG